MLSLLYFISQNFTMLLFSVIGFLLMVMFYRRRKRGRLPPGPPNLPLVGSLPFLSRDPRELLRKMAKKYGDMTTVYLGPKPAIFLNNYDVIKEAFAKWGHVFAGRPQDLFSFKVICRGRGIISTEGEVWKEQRRFTHTVLKDLGIGRVMLEPKIQEEIQYYLSELQRSNGRPVEPSFVTMMAVCNMVFSIVTGRRYDYDDAEFTTYVSDLNFAFNVLGFSGVVMLFPALRFLPGDPFYCKRVIKFSRDNEKKFLRSVQEHRKSHDPENPRDFIDVYLAQMEQQKKLNPDTTFEENQLLQIIGDLFAAGTETTSSSLLWCLIYMLNFPDVMKRCQAEIDDVIGRHRAPSMKDKASMPYVHAVILEVQRMADLAPFGIPHTCLEDVDFRGYRFPRGTMFMALLYAVHYDETIWPEPETFKPQRHLTEDGKLAKKEEHIVFGTGRRVCLGESLAKVELFLFFTSILQKFDLVLPEGEPTPSLKGELGATHNPHKFNVIFRERN